MVLCHNPEELASYTPVDVPIITEHPLLAHWEYRIDQLVATNPYFSKRPPRPYQKRYAAVACMRPRNMFAHEQGCGKSYCAGIAIHLLYGAEIHKLRPGSIHILAPRHAVNLVWFKKELEAVGLQPYSAVISSPKDLTNKAPIWIYHFDLLKQKSGSKQVVDFIARTNYPKFLVIDEAHKLRLDTNRTDAVKKLVKRSKRILALTGTPMDGWVSHLASILSVVYTDNSLAFPYDAHSFKTKFTRKEVTTADYVTGSKTGSVAKKRLAPGIAAEQMPLFHQATRHLIHRLTFADLEVSPHVDFPKMDHQIREVVLDLEHRAFYNQIHEQVIRHIQDAIQALDAGKISRNLARHNVLTHLNVLRAAVNHPKSLGYTGGDVQKLVHLRDIVETYTAQQRKIIIYTNRVDSGREAYEYLEKAGFNFVRLYAEDPQAKPKTLNTLAREQVIEKFQEDARVQGIVGNLPLMAESLTLIEASIGIHHDHDWKSTDWSQGNNRFVRPGQLYDPVPVIDLVATGTIDEYVFWAMQRKAQATRQILDKEFDVVVSAEVDQLDVARSLLEDFR